MTNRKPKTDWIPPFKIGRGKYYQLIETSLDEEREILRKLDIRVQHKYTPVPDSYPVYCFSMRSGGKKVRFQKKKGQWYLNLDISKDRLPFIYRIADPRSEITDESIPK